MSQIRLILLGGAVRELRLAATLAQESGAQVRFAQDSAEALAFARLHGADLMMADLSADVPALIASLRGERIALPVLACGVDARATEAVAAVRAGAIDYLPLPPSRDLIAAALLSIGHRRIELIGEAPEWRRAVSQAERFAAARTPILLCGAPGTGKQTLGRHLHLSSGRSGPLVLLDAAAMIGRDEEAVASELFGHRAGAFDGALADRPGKIAEAAGGTLLIRRVDQLPHSLQQALVPAVRSGSARIIATTCSPDALHSELAATLGTARVGLPTLSARGDDLVRLARLFGSQLAIEEELPAPRFSRAALEALHRHDWPGNVAELEQVVHRALLLAAGAPIGPDDLVLDHGRTAGGGELAVGALVGRSMEEVERALILGTLARCGGNRTSASAILGISVRTMRNKLRALRLEGVAA